MPNNFLSELSFGGRGHAETNRMTLHASDRRTPDSRRGKGRADMKVGSRESLEAEKDGQGS